jgi:hypothetical protein
MNVWRYSQFYAWKFTRLFRSMLSSFLLGFSQMIPWGAMTDMRYIHIPCKFGFIRLNKFYSNLRNTVHSL